MNGKRSVMKLFYDPSDIISQLVRIVLAEKAVQYELESVADLEELKAKLDSQKNRKDQIDLKSHIGSLPVLIDRDEVILDNYLVIIEYLEERHPHPPLYQGLPHDRALARITACSIVEELYPCVCNNDYCSFLNPSKAAKKQGVNSNIFLVDSKSGEQTEDQDDKKLKKLVEKLECMSSCIGNYVMGDEFGLVDCYLAPLLWRLSRVHSSDKNRYVDFKNPKLSNLRRYMERLFNRESCKACLPYPYADDMRKHFR